MHIRPVRASVLVMLASLAPACDDAATSPNSHEDTPPSVQLRSAALPGIGQEVAVPVHLADGEEHDISLEQLLEHGKGLFTAVWTIQEGGGRPLTTGTGKPLADPGSPLVFPRNFNRVSAPDANSCAGCHNAPFGQAGGGGDIVANVFVLGQRFDFATFDGSDLLPLRGAVDELGNPVRLQTIANERNTLGMFGSGYIEMLARQMTADLQAIRDDMAPGDSSVLVSKGVTFGTLSRAMDGSWDVSAVEGLRPAALATTGPADPPSLVIAPFHQAGAVVSLREFTNNAFNHHHGMQATERFGVGTDPDGDGFTDELTVADITAASVFQATLPVPGRVIPDDPAIEEAIVDGEQLFDAIGCGDCHVPALPLDADGWEYVEPNPFNPAGNLQPGDADPYLVDLNDKDLPRPRLEEKDGVVWVPAFTDLKLHDITAGAGDPNREPLNMQHPGGSPEFVAGNAHFLTRKLWGTANEPPYYHHGKYTTLRQAVVAHDGESLGSRLDYEALTSHEQDCVIEFLKSLQVLPPGTKWLEVDEHGHKKSKNWRKPYLD
ncbi:MAG: thiol oxidoreductase [Myxococcales bacterium]|nr:thiol oxidoreductase [Myxococcales bacterium]